MKHQTTSERLLFTIEILQPKLRRKLAYTSSSESYIRIAKFQKGFRVYFHVNSDLFSIKCRKVIESRQFYVCKTWYPRESKPNSGWKISIKACQLSAKHKISQQNDIKRLAAVSARLVSFRQATEIGFSSSARRHRICGRRMPSKKMFFAKVIALSVAVSVAYAHGDHHQEVCTANGERCAGAPGKPYVEYHPCCSEGYICIEKQNPGYDEWGRYCMEPSNSYHEKCYQSGERCMGAPGHDYVQYHPCCSPGEHCMEDPELGWGGFCKPGGAKAKDKYDYETYTTKKPEITTTKMATTTVTTQPKKDDYPTKHDHYHEDYYDHKDPATMPATTTTIVPPKDHKSYGYKHEYMPKDYPKSNYEPKSDYGHDSGYGKGGMKGHGGTKGQGGAGGNDQDPLCAALPGQTLAVNAFPFFPPANPATIPMGQSIFNYDLTVNTDPCGNSGLTARSLTLEGAQLLEDAICGAAFNSLGSIGGALVPNSCGIYSIATGSLRVRFTLRFFGTINPQALVNALNAFAAEFIGGVVTGAAGPVQTAAPSPAA